MVRSIRSSRTARTTEAPTGPAEQTCPDCHRPLILHQPEMDVPDRLLGTCSNCHAWVIIDFCDDGTIELTELTELPKHPL